MTTLNTQDLATVFLYLSACLQNTKAHKLFKWMHPDFKWQQSTSTDFIKVLRILFCMGKSLPSPPKLPLQQHKDARVDGAHFHKFTIQSYGIKNGCCLQNMSSQLEFVSKPCVMWLLTSHASLLPQPGLGVSAAGWPWLRGWDDQLGLLWMGTVWIWHLMSGADLSLTTIYVLLYFMQTSGTFKVRLCTGTE